MLYVKTFHLNTGAHKLHHIHVSGIIVVIASQLAHKHDIGIGLLKTVVTGFCCDYVSWRILTNKEIYAVVKEPTITETVRLNRLCWFGHVQRMEENRISKKKIFMNLEATRLRGRPRNRWQDEVREDGRLVGGKGWKERVYSREEWKNCLRMA